VTTTDSFRTSLPAPVEASVGDHAAIGDMGTVALVDRWGRMDWLCWPRFDDAPLFRRLLDPHTGGHWTLAPAAPFTAERQYARDTNAVETVFECAQGSAVVHEFLAVPADERGPQVVRIVEGRSGRVPFRSTLRATPGFAEGRSPVASDGGVVRVEDRAVLLTSHPADVDVQGDTVQVDVTVEPGTALAFVLTTPGTAARPGPDIVTHATRLRRTTQRWWRNWLSRATLPATASGAAARSALTVKMLYHERTGALVAAPTTSLPERVGGQRNWDYRYCWLRDNALMILALQHLGLHDESMAHWDWLAATCARDEDLSIAYTIDGKPVPPERIVEHLPGHRSSPPVRVGNDAAPQRQHDVYGSVMDAAAYCFEQMADMDRAMPGPVLQRIADLAAERWGHPDDSIWEVRNGRAQHTYSMLMSWVALRRAVDLHDADALTGDVRTWTRERDRIRTAILDRCWNSDLEAFTATAGGDLLDAATLAIPLHGLLPADDHRCRATRYAVIEQLADGGLIRRYRYDDGLTDLDNPFLLCTLWLADNHSLDDEPDHAEDLLERVLATGNDLGLLAEEADPDSHEPVGNFPQGLTHLGVIASAARIDQARTT
jgi:GH15 family glucan-1,4-alpha-glucosidase